MNPEVFGCFPCFSIFLIFHDFGWFWGDLAMKFYSLARFPARGWSQISLGLNFKLVQVRACPNSFFWGRMFRSRCLGHSQTCRYARSPKNTKRIWFLKFTAQSVDMNFFSARWIIFLFICSSCVALTINPTASKNGPQTTALRQNAASISAVGRKIGPQSIELSDFTHTSL